MPQTNVLIVGAGPTGLTLALWLNKQGVAVRIVDKSSGPGETSRAMAVQARTLELYRQLDMADAVVDAGYKTPAMNMWARGNRKARIPLIDAGEEISPYPFVLIYPQDSHERLLIEQLQSLGIEVERQTELLSFEEEASQVTALLRHADGHEETFTASYLAGCDGARSLVRHAVGGGFEGGTYKQLFYVADVIASGVAPAGEAHIAFDKSEFVLLLSYGEADRYRLIGTARDERAEQPETLTFADVGHDAINGLNIKISGVNWFSTYRVHHRVADRFRHGRTFLLGDAAHVHSPAGGQGMNTGILDAVNLAWKLAAVLNGKACDALLDSYQVERQAFARKLVKTTDRLFTVVTAQGGFADFVRTRIAPLIASVAYKRKTVREYLFRIVSQTTLNYHGSPLSQGKAGDIQGGDRLPWVSVPGSDNYEPLRAIQWQVHVYGEARHDLVDWCKTHDMPLHVFTWRPEYRKAGMARDAAYLLRPDTYVALADPNSDTVTLSRYFSERGFEHQRLARSSNP
ncbi:FAD-dependent monooxygenase [Pseudomonas sp. B21-056]|jgi:2-polyprenyl-6-methoxyphenol hydroxylase-like FAD-dependent oxidoreductase|uniref:FAD-dependent monooxygenase n=1 Tax=Pseudomonas sp. B21-056 TaxID=2895495 RepID=UPI00222F789D|nr:FAD-dependent monooxygenase [Pseudomonas sp. B21-056]UZE21105.1 FAD-dependent monooxygenase [Pseudomonas sp. B21-056]